jgi:hypothetical protein
MNSLPAIRIVRFCAMLELQGGSDNIRSSVLTPHRDMSFRRNMATSVCMTASDVVPRDYQSSLTLRSRVGHVSNPNRGEDANPNYSSVVACQLLPHGQ